MWVGCQNYSPFLGGCQNYATIIYYNGKSNGNYHRLPQIMENQMEKNMENEMETGIILGLY